MSKFHKWTKIVLMQRFSEGTKIVLNYMNEVGIHACKSQVIRKTSIIDTVMHQTLWLFNVIQKLQHDQSAFCLLKHFETGTNEVVSRFWRKSRRFIKAASPPASKRASSPSSWSEEHLFGRSWHQLGLFVITVLSLPRIDF